MKTADDLALRGYKLACYGSPWKVLGASKTVRVPLCEYWGNPVTGHFIAVYRGPDAASACRGHWKFNSLAAWCRWHFSR